MALLLQVTLVALLTGTSTSSSIGALRTIEGLQCTAQDAGPLSEVLASSAVAGDPTATPIARPALSPTAVAPALPPRPAQVQSPPTPAPPAPIAVPVRRAQAPSTPTPLPPPPAPSPTPVAPPPSSPPPAATDGCEQIIAMVNDVRAQNGLSTLVYNRQLAADAQQYADFLAANDALTHTADGRTLDKRAEAAGYTTWTAIGENLAGGYTTYDQALSAWMASPGHRENILNPVFQETGVGCAWNPNSTHGSFFVQEFGTRW